MGGEWRDLQRAAHEIDHQLKGGQPDGSSSSSSSSPQFRTLVHGDMKAANILFSPGRPLQCAAYDLQYCGGGYGVKDIVYLLASSVEASVVQQHEQALLDFYRAELVGQLGPERGAAYTADVMQRHYKLAMLDYVRFMAGWANIALDNLSCWLGLAGSRSGLLHGILMLAWRACMACTCYAPPWQLAVALEGMQGGMGCRIIHRPDCN